MELIKRLDKLQYHINKQNNLEINYCVFMKKFKIEEEK